MTPRKEKAFTLIELLVVIAIIALLLAIIMPALNKVKEQAAQIPCLANMKTLAFGFYMYQEENAGKLLNAYTWTADVKDSDAWVYPPTTMLPTDPHTGPGINLYNPSECTVEREVNGIKRGKLWDYVEDKDVYHCPADKRAGRADVGFRSYSMINTIRDPHFNNNATHMVEKMGDIRSPSDKYIIVEAQRMMGGSPHWNMGSWCFDIQTQNFNEPPANWHSKGVSLSFADGHAEKYKWRSKAMKDWLAMEPLPDVAPASVIGSEDAMYFYRSIPRGDG
ncbi:MAG: prepilin-type N-terminal cleavage/methylation domain-containing protein [Nitrosomonadaceae bacterium]